LRPAFGRGGDASAALAPAAARAPPPRRRTRAAALGGACAISIHVPASSSSRACQPQPSRAQRRTVPKRFVAFSVTKGAAQRGHGAITGWSHAAKVHSG
jgi:hypothetical protein